MTTICYRDEVMASDSRAYTGSPTPIGNKTKIRRIEEGKFSGSLIGVSTTVPGLSELIFDWVSADMPEESRPSFQDKMCSLLIVTSDKEIYFASNELLLSGPIEAPFFAIGSGEEYAMGALQMGASASEAVKVASMFDVWTNDVVNSVHLNRKSELFYRLAKK